MGHSRFLMFGFMTGRAEGLQVARVVSKFRVQSNGLHVVKFEVAVFSA